MAIPDLEVLLVIGIVAFYAQDAMMLLYHDELVFERVARRWRPSPGSSQWQGLFLFIPNLLAPWRPLLRGAIPDAPSAIPEASSLEPVLKALRPLQVGVTLLAALLQIGRAHVELQSLMRISYAVFCLKKKINVPDYQLTNMYAEIIRTTQNTTKDT